MRINIESLLLGGMLLVLTMGIVPFVHAQEVKWVSTTEMAPWVTQAPQKLEKINKEEVDSALVIDPKATAQQITGWGGCFNELGWKALLALDEKGRDEVMNALFDQKEGSRFNICRTPMAASDFAIDAYSYDDVPGDYDLKGFSIDRDKKYLLPYIKAAMKVNPKLKLWASPWSPPAWMKTNSKYDSGSLRMEPAILNTYAHYQARYVLEYKKEGVDIIQIHPQNEPIYETKYPSCKWDNPETMNNYIKNYLGPLFKKEKIPAQIWFGTITNKDSSWFKHILDDKETMQYISGLGLQYNSRYVLSFLRRNTNLPMMETETKCYNGKNAWKDADDTYGLMKQYLNGGCQAYMYWNMVLDETGLSSWAWSQNSSVTIDTKAKKIIYNPQFYVMKHFSRYVSPGAYLLKTNKQEGDALAFKNPDGSIVVVVENKKGEKPFSLVIGQKKMTAVLAEKSYNTFIIK